MGYFFFFKAEDGIRYLVRSRGLGDVYKRQVIGIAGSTAADSQGDGAVVAAVAGRYRF